MKVVETGERVDLSLFHRLHKYHLLKKLAPDVMARSEFHVKNGGRLRANNYRNTRIYLFQELMDALMHCHKLEMEGLADADDECVFESLCQIALCVKNKLEGDKG